MIIKSRYGNFTKNQKKNIKILETPYQSLSFVRGSQKDKDIS